MSATARPLRRLPWTVGLWCLGALLPLWPAGTGHVHAADGTVDVTITAGVDSWADPGDHVVVAVEITTTDLFDGHVDIVATSGGTVTAPVEVAGGTTKTVRLVAPTSVDNLSVDVRVYEGDNLLERRTVTLKAAESVELVGVLPALRTRIGELPPTVTIAGDMGKAVVATLPSEVLALGATALEAFDTVVGTTADLRSLPPAQQAALFGWVNRGGRLLLDDRADLSSLPAEWRPGAAGYALAGQGEVRLLDGDATEGRWASFIQPSGSSQSELGDPFAFSEVFASPSEDLARRAGVRLPSLMPVLIPLIVYWAVISIVLFLVLKASRRLTLAWVAIPALAALTAGAVLVYGNHWRSAGKPAATTFVDGWPGGGTASSSVLLFSRDGGTITVGLPEQWQSDSEVAAYWGGFGSLPATVQPAGDGTDLRVRLDAGQVTTANITGPTAAVGLDITAISDGSHVTGTVTNTSSVTLHQVAVFGPGGADDVGDLAPGASADFSISANALPAGFALATRVWTPATDPRRDPDDIAELGIWSNAAVSRVMYPSAMVRAAGWTTERAAPADIDASSATVVTSTAHVAPAGDDLPASCIRFAAVRSPFQRFGNGLEDQVFRFVLPPTATPPALLLEVPAEVGTLQIWNGSGWVDLQRAARVANVPPNAVRDGVVLVRIPNNGMFLGPESHPVLRGATA